ncbi:Uu.00g126270.m01.CDS01 [Anthostomella pinea]|uniref:Uu.00g126270.m01.CDS01 n=1 Tax=Anthostomella pinea TaxID=933095 RepID=A0AAI8YFC9_9PEZI|nr:Uu.00g126270.m01.CDS01 [Anthostomella pinea]
MASEGWGAAQPFPVMAYFMRAQEAESNQPINYQVNQQADDRPTGKGGSINWSEIAESLPGRSNKDCRKRHLNEMDGTSKKGPWSKEEDAQLESLVKIHGPSWVAVSEAIGNRSADQCSKRWHHSLSPELDRRPWTEDEVSHLPLHSTTRKADRPNSILKNLLLLHAFAKHGSCWKEMQDRHFPARSANNVKNQ